MTTRMDSEPMHDSPMTLPWTLIELRQYTLHPGQRDTLIDLFEREFVESQEALGIGVIGQFRDLDDPNQFVWLRGFRSLAARGAALAAFYDGPVWKVHRQAANATMLDSDNVLMLRPVAATAEPPHEVDGGDGTSRHLERPGRIVVVTLRYVEPEVLDEFASFFETTMRPVLEAAGASIFSTLRTATVTNNFPRLPVREGEYVFVWLTAFDDVAAHETFRAALARGDDWRASASPQLLRQFMRRPETLRLAPTPRSRLR